MQLKLLTIMVILVAKSFAGRVATVPSTPEPVAPNQADSVEATFKFLEEGEKLIKLSANKNITLVLGLNGSGKTTLTHFIAGDNAKLLSKRAKGSINKYIVEDSSGGIQSGSISQTIFPDMVIGSTIPLMFRNMTLDGQLNVFYDCPSFNDNINASMELASTYFLKKVIENAEFVKIILTASHFAFDVFNDRGDHFKLLLQHAGSLIRNADKYKNSISLVVTKVANEVYWSEKIAKPKPDRELINAVANFLIELKPELGEVSPFRDDHDLHLNAMAIIDALLEKKVESFQRIGIFRMPNKPGPLSDIKNLQNGKENIMKIVYENTQFTAKANGDFGYTVPADSKYHIQALVDIINRRITEDLTTIAQEIRDQFDLREAHNQDLKSLYDNFNLGYISLVDMKNSIKSSSKPVRALLKFTAVMKSLKIGVSSKLTSNVQKNFNFLKILYAIRDTKPSNPLTWAESLTSVIDHMESSKLWYNFLAVLFNVASEYHVQKDVKRFNTVEIFKQIISHTEKEVSISDISLEPLLKQLDNSQKTLTNIFADVRSFKINQRQLTALKNLLDATLNFVVDLSCQSNKLVVKGNFIKMSEVASKKCPTNIEIIEVFALYKVMFDSNFDKTGEQVQLSIISTTWEVLGSPKIILDGKLGVTPPAKKSEVKTSKTDDTSMGFVKIIGKAIAQLSAANGGDGKAGEPGEPGGPGGHFMGIGRNFINGPYLTISTTGGRGGTGQRGGNGAEGTVGTTPGTGDLLKNYYRRKWWKDLEDYYRGKFNFDQKSTCDSKTSSPTYIYAVHGTSGGKGGKGGAGGAKGLGGNSGQTFVFGVEVTPEISVQNSTSAAGNDGAGGTGGLGGVNGNDIHILYVGDFYCNYSPFDLYLRQSKGRSTASGDSGTGSNDKGRKSPEAVKSIEDFYAINNYKSFLRENLKGNVMASDLAHFIDQMNNDTGVVGVYGTLGLVNELQTIEDQFFGLKHQIDFSPFYQSLLTR